MEEPKKQLRMKYEKTVLVDYDELIKRTIPSHEVPDKSIYKHKPLKKNKLWKDKDK